jgi:hypothetical protein
MNLEDLTANAFDNDTRALAAFAAIQDPPGDMPFSREVLDALARLDWRALLHIAFSEPLDARRTMEFMDTMLNLCDAAQQSEMASFLYAKNPRVSDFIAADYKDAFMKIPRSMPADLMAKALNGKDAR